MFVAADERSLRDQSKRRAGVRETLARKPLRRELAVLSSGGSRLSDDPHGAAPIFGDPRDRQVHVIPNWLCQDGSAHEQRERVVVEAPETAPDTLVDEFEAQLQVVRESLRAHVREAVTGPLNDLVLQEDPEMTRLVRRRCPAPVRGPTTHRSKRS